MFTLLSTNEVEGLTYTYNSFSLITESMVTKTLAKLNAEEKAMLYKAQAQGVIISFTLPDNTGLAGGFLTPYDGVKEHPVLRLTIYFGSIILKGIIAHELVHFEQWRRGDLQFLHDDDQHVMWKGEKMPISNTAGMAYLEQPWELEAYHATAAFKATVGWMSENFHYNTTVVACKWADTKSKIKQFFK